MLKGLAAKLEEVNLLAYPWLPVNSEMNSTGTIVSTVGALPWIIGVAIALYWSMLTWILKDVIVILDPEAIVGNPDILTPVDT